MVSNVPTCKEVKTYEFKGVDMVFTQSMLDDPTPMTKAQLCEMLIEASTKPDSTIEVEESPTRFQR